MSYVPNSVYFVDGRLIVNGQRVYGDASSHVDANPSSRITNYGIITYSGRTCVCVEVTNIAVYTWRYINGSGHMEYLTVPLGQFVIDLETGACISGGVLQWY
ncbi:hypothetical protein [Clostridium cellulovorans]|uniref:Uncharacterized protein n=1 Tax=Clostridium cellulovorans (strain ATCC 35296 / DSM 3052 / OCM 3 / 743B) TaxID=573061 RepID=D9SQ94_CLOC7|nr:hypothetical protein [Clostridium cellulovorans]ADL50161.1 hypothetical protein Clocel_0381 [Clostridium cellulovorans 743B]